LSDVGYCAFALDLDLDLDLDPASHIARVAHKREELLAIMRDSQAKQLSLANRHLLASARSRIAEERRRSRDKSTAWQIGCTPPH